MLRAAAAAMAWPGSAAWQQAAAGAHLQIARHAAAKAKAKGKQQQKGKQLKGKQPVKKVKLRMESKPFDEKDPLNQRVISLLAAAPMQPAAAAAASGATVPSAPSSSAPSQQPQQQPQQQQLDPEADQRTRAYTRQRMAEYMAWRQDLHTKLQLKRAALAALPPDLRGAAEAEDTAAFPLTRHFLYDSPPEAYRD
jgi:hypothetical protein